MADIKKLDLKSKNITDEQKVKLKELFPEILTEGKIDFEKLRLTLGDEVDDGEERFGMTWPGKRDCFKVIQEPSIGTLKPCKEESVDFDTTENLFIEGDNLEVLKLMQKSYYGKVKMIYIDPPYNTGNEFIYPDKYSESLETYLAYTGQVDDEGRKFSTNTEADGRFHSKWLNMMYPRLFLARNLLRDDGVIFISIDDNEVHNLKLLVNELFGEENILPQIVRRSKVGGGSDNKQIAKEADFVLGAAKNIETLNKFFLPHTEKDLERYNQADKISRYFWDTYSRTGLASDDPESDSLYYEVEFPDGSKRVDRWRRSKKRLQKDIETEDAKFVQTVNGWNIHFKQRLNVEGKRPRQILYKDMGNNFGNTELNELSLGSVFQYPKPSILISCLSQISKTEKNIILDFFSGSCTTAHAVLELNKKDGGARKFIMVQLPEPCEEDSEAFKTGYKNIADIGKERIRKVIKKINQEKEGVLDLGEQKQDLGFKVFKLDKSNFKIWDGNVKEKPIHEQLEFAIDHIDPNSKEEDILYEILLKSGFELTTPVETLTLEDKKVYSVAECALLICLEMNLTTELIRAIAKMEPQRVVCLDSGFEGNDQLKTNAVQIMKSFDVESFRTV